MFGVDATTVTERGVEEGVVGVVPPLVVFGVVEGVIRFLDTILYNVVPK